MCRWRRGLGTQPWELLHLDVRRYGDRDRGNGQARSRRNEESPEEKEVPKGDGAHQLSELRAEMTIGFGSVFRGTFSSEMGMKGSGENGGQETERGGKGSREMGPCCRRDLGQGSPFCAWPSSSSSFVMNRSPISPPPKETASDIRDLSSRSTLLLRSSNPAQLLLWVVLPLTRSILWFKQSFSINLEERQLGSLQRYFIRVMEKP